MLDELNSRRLSESCVFEIHQQGRPSPCYVIVPDTQDLVKSHLMFAVREEVEVLKEKIAELMDRISQLELENTFLKAHATPETLSQLGGGAQPQPPPQQQSSAPPPAQQQQPPPANGSVS